MDNSSKQVLNEYEKATASNTAVKHKIRSDYSRFDRRNTMAADAATPEEKPAPRAKISLSVIFMYLIIAGFAMLLINSYVRLTVLTNDISKQTAEYEKLQDDYVKLTAQNDKRYNLSEIEEYAVNVLGMSKLESSQVENIELTAEESIKVIDDGSESKLSGFFDSLLEKLRTALEFFA